jgi:ectoine hydroxylase-related dioxygenase (phytanoyl-CoA dioxygenase family)
VLFSTFVALQDVRLEMGPTIFLPRTHTAAMHAQFRDQKFGKGGSEKREKGERGSEEGVRAEKRREDRRERE